MSAGNPVAVTTDAWSSQSQYGGQRVLELQAPRTAGLVGTADGESRRDRASRIEL